MASRKEYEMLFALNAKMNGGFSGTFSKAQAEFSRLGKEIQDLHKLQGDINSYQKQERALESTRSKLASLQKQHDLLQKEIGETDGSTTALERENVKLEQRIKDTETALERQSQKLSDTGARLREAGVDTGNLAGKSAELSAKLRDLEQQQDEAANSAEDFGVSASAAFDAIAQSAITSQVIEYLGQMKDAFVECVGVAGEFEETMSTVEALSGANAQDMAALSAEAKELGATTKFTAKEAGDAMSYMAMAGWDATDMLQGMDGVLQLAAASGEDLAMVSDIVTDNLSAFGLTAKDTAHFSDVLAAAATSANTNVAIMGETFKQSASVAGALGYSIEDVGVAVGLMANSGVKGSIAGTALKNTFNGLLEGVTLTGAAFGEYEYSAIKADGTMKSFGASINELRGYFEQMTEAERVNNAMAIAGQRGYNGLLAILNATDADYASLTESINNCTGAAQRMAEIKLDNLNGQLTLMDSAWDALKTTIGEQFIPEMRGLAEVGTDVFTGVNEFVKANPGVVKGIAAGVAVIGTATAALTAYAAVKKVVNALNLVPMIASTGPILAGVAAVAALTGVIIGLNEAAKNNLDESWELTASSREQYEQLQELNAEYDRAVEQFGAASYEAQSLRWKIEDLNAEYESGRRTLEEYQSAHESLMDSYRNMAESHIDTAAGLDLEGASVEALIQKLGELGATSGSAAQNQEAILAIIERLNEVVPGLAVDYDSITSDPTAYIESLYAVAQAQADAKKKAADYAEYVDRVGQQGGLKAAQEDAAEQAQLAQEDYEAALKAYNEAAALYQYDTTGIGLYFGTRNEAAALDEAKAQLDSYNKILDETTAAYEENEAALKELETAFQGNSTAQENTAAGAQDLENAISRVAEEAAALTEQYNAMYDAAYASVEGQYQLWDEAAKVVEVNAGTISTALESQATYWQDYNTNLQALSERTNDIEGLRDMLSTFADGSQGSVNAIAGMADATDEELKDMVSNWQALKEEQALVSGSIADLKTDFSNTMDELQSELEKDIEAMDLGDEAKEAGVATIQGYLSAATEMLPQVENAYAALAQAANTALSYRDVATKSKDPAYIPQYAGGTDSAAPGVALVGEEGPELVLFHGGEKVLNANQTANAVTSAELVSAVGEEQPTPVLFHGGERALSAVQAVDTFTNAEPVSAIPDSYNGGSGGGNSGNAAPVQVTIQIAGNATPETVADLRAAAQDIVNQVLDALDERAEDEKRCSMR